MNGHEKNVEARLFLQIMGVLFFFNFVIVVGTLLTGDYPLMPNTEVLNESSTSVDR